MTSTHDSSAWCDPPGERGRIVHPGHASAPERLKSVAREDEAGR